MENILFLIQGRSMGSSSRGPQAGGRILTKEDMLDVNYYLKCTAQRCVIYYQIGRELAKSISSMKLDEFEECFSQKEIQDGCLNHLLGKIPGKECIFRSEIRKKYGDGTEIAGEFNQRYEKGVIVEDKHGYRYAYLGKFNSFSIEVNGITKVSMVSPSNIFIPLSRYNREDFTSFGCGYFTNYLNRLYRLGIWSDFGKNCFIKEKKRARVCTDLMGLFLEKSGVCSVEGVGLNHDVEYVIRWELLK